VDSVDVVQELLEGDVIPVHLLSLKLLLTDAKSFMKHVLDPFTMEFCGNELTSDNLLFSPVLQVLLETQVDSATKSLDGKNPIYSTALAIPSLR